MTDQKETNTIYVNPSNVTELFNLHVLAMVPCADCPESKSFAIAKGELSFRILQQLAEAYSVGKKCYVVIEHDEVFEVYRANDGTPRNLLVNYAVASKVIEIDAGQDFDATKSFLELLRNYLQSELVDVIKYDKALNLEDMQAGIISAQFIQRRLLSTAPYRKSAKGATNQFRDVTAKLLKAEVIKQIESENGAKTLYKINKSVLETFK